MNLDERFDFFDVRINATNLSQTAHFLRDYQYSNVGYICFPDSSVVAAAQDDEALKKVLNNALLTLPDGKPSEIAARMKGYKQVSTVSGYWLSKELFRTSLTHFFLGSTEAKLTKMVSSVRAEFPEVKILGHSSLPFKDADFFKSGNIFEEELDTINRLRPDLIWVGLSSPKQDFLMRNHVPRLQHGVMLGVGGVFDYLSGDVRKSPEWIKKIGLRWLWRLAREPRRLGQKYWLTMKVLLKIVVKRN